MKQTVMKLVAPAAMMMLISAALTTAATASIISLNETFTATAFSAGAPLSSVTGTFSLSFDNSADAVDTSGTVLTISVPGLSLAGTTSMFSYNFVQDRLHLGAYSAGNFVTNAGSNYIDLDIGNISTTPVFIDAQYSQVGATSNFVSRTGTVTPIAAAVPEPASLALLSIALGVLGLSRRRKSA